MNINKEDFKNEIFKFTNYFFYITYRMIPEEVLILVWNGIRRYFEKHKSMDFINFYLQDLLYEVDFIRKRGS